MDGGDREPMEWKEDERTSELAGEWTELEFMMIDNRIITKSVVCSADVFVFAVVLCVLQNVERP